jgi:ribosome assembly protein SQT1
MSHHPNDGHEHEQLEEEDIIEVVEDEGEGYEPMDDDDDDNAKYDGEIVIGAPMPGEEGYEDEEMGERVEREDNSWGVSGEWSVS